MKYTNAYFQLITQDNGVSLRYFPPQEGGRGLEMQELAAYLDTCGIKDCNLADLNRKILASSGVTDIPISSIPIAEVNEMAQVRVSDNRMLAYIRFYPPSLHGKRMTEKDILNELERVHVRFGISIKIIQAFLMGPQYCRDIPIAKGRDMIPGRDASIEYRFETAPTQKPKLLEDGTVDFHELNLFTGVKAGDLLAIRIPPQEGEAGKDVYGNEVPPRKAKNKALKYGRNIRISEDKNQIFSEVDGDVKLEGDTVFVSDTYHVPADVDNSTGDIHYNGNVCVTGNVRTGFTVEASGDIEVAGVVEGATLIAGGNIVLKRGVQGMNRGLLQAGNDVVTKFIESCVIKAGGSINTGSSLHSDLTAADSIIVSGRKGFLIGGNAMAGKRIEASVFGNKMNTVTTLKVGVKPEVLDRYKQLSQEIRGLQEDAAKYKQILELFRKKLQEGQKPLPNQIVLAKQTGEQFKQTTEALEQKSSEYLLLKEQIERDSDGRVIVNHTVYPGTCISISNRIFNVKDALSRCQFRINGADVVSHPI